MRRGDYPGLVVRQKSPLNLEYQFSSLSDWLIPSDQFYVRSHFPTPKLSATEWRLAVAGTVERPFEIGLDEILAMRATRLAAVMECAGNGRVFLIPHVEGAQWELGAVGNAEWTGVPLRALLERAGMEEDACEIKHSRSDH